MMGCLAALSLAGCGDSGGGSSTVPSERLISEGYSTVKLSSDESGKVSYGCILESNGMCLFFPVRPSSFCFKGRWTEEFLGDGKFLITFGDFSPLVTSANWKCTIDFTPGPITLTITNMSAYRAAQEVSASFDKAPFTHTAGDDCPDPSSPVGTGLKLIMLSGSSSGSSGSDLQ